MSYREYEELFQKCQKTAPYHMFIYDVKGSRQISSQKMRSDLILLTFSVLKEIKKREKETRKTIWHCGNGLILPEIVEKEKEGISYYDIQYPRKIERADSLEPYIGSGDLIAFTIKRDSMQAKEVNTIFDSEKEKLQIPYDFHRADGYYETDFYQEGDKQYFRGYCLQRLEEESKKNRKESEYEEEIR